MSTDTSKISERFRRQYERGTDLLSPVPPMPKNLMVELSNACNHACIFCTNPNMTRRAGRFDAALLDRLMVEARAEGVEEIGFYTTGEPFVHKQLEQFVRRAAELEYGYIYISTNGAMATPERLKLVIDAGLNSLKFSINAGSRESYKLVHGYDDWDNVIANLEFASQYRKTLNRPLKLFVTFIVTRHTAHEVEAFRERIGPLVDEVMFHQVHNQSGQMNDAQEILKQSDEPTSFKVSAGICMMPFNRLHVSCEGYLTLCCVDYQNYLALADLRKMSLAEAWEHPLFQEMRRRHLEHDLKGTLCGSCWQGCKDKIAPLVPELATEVDFTDFHRKAADAVRDRLRNANVAED